MAHPSYFLLSVTGLFTTWQNKGRNSIKININFTFLIQ
jgi:hypothetical protein